MLTPLYCSLDIESCGPTPVKNSMRSIGIACFSQNGEIVSTFYKTLLPQKNADGTDFEQNQVTMNDFWNVHKEQWKEVNTNCITPTLAMKQLSEFFQQLMKNYDLKFVAKPANFDWMFLSYYYERFGPVDKPSIGFYCHCLSSLLRSYTMCNGIRDKKPFISQLAKGLPYTHNALDDAIYQGTVYMSLRILLHKSLTINTYINNTVWAPFYPTVQNRQKNHLYNHLYNKTS